MQVGVKHIVFSGLEDVRAFNSILDKLPEACPGYKIPHCECKAQIRVRCLRCAQVWSAQPCTLSMSSCCWDVCFH